MLAQAGWLALCAAALALLVNVGAAARRAVSPLSLPARIVAVAQPFLAAGLAVATVAALADGPATALWGPRREVIGILLVAGWIGLTVLGSVIHLLSVVLRVRSGFQAALPRPRPRLDSSLAALAALGVGLVALRDAGDAAALATALLLSAYAVLAGRVAILVVRVLQGARPRV